MMSRVLQVTLHTPVRQVPIAGGRVVPLASRANLQEFKEFLSRRGIPAIKESRDGQNYQALFATCYKVTFERYTERHPLLHVVEIETT